MPADRTLAAMSRWSAPGRVNLIGEHLDYNGGPVLPIAIDRRTSVTASPRDDGQVSVSSVSEPTIASFDPHTSPGEVEGWAAYVAGVFWALADTGHRVPGVDLWISSDVPTGAGLSSSAALECAVAVALRDLAELPIDDIDLALLAQRAENDYVGVPSGVMDQLAAMCGREGHAVLIDTTGPAVEQVPADWEGDGLRLLVIDTRVQHALGDGEYGNRRRQCDEAATTLGVMHLAEATIDDVERLDDDLLRRRTRHVVTETRRVREVTEAVSEGRWEAVGGLFTASHASLRDDFEVSSRELDAAVDAALAAGALGARMTGGGFGGSAIALVAEDSVGAVEKHCRTAFAEAGWEEPHVFAVSPAAGAGRVD
jgi:galactokinase